jgi:pilus assembly protein CpaF
VRDLLRNALRMRPDRILVGECRGAEAFDMLQAMNTGHDGSMTTLHASSAQQALTRLESMLLMSGFEVPVAALRNYIADAVHLVVHLERLPDGRRVVGEIAQLQRRDDSLQVEVLHRFEPDSAGVTRFSATGHRPAFADLLAKRGVVLDDSMFEPGRLGGAR